MVVRFGNQTYYITNKFKIIKLKGLGFCKKKKKKEKGKKNQISSEL